MKSEPISQNRILFPSVLQKRPHDAYKGSVGKVLIIAGSDGMTGSAALACRSAMRTGAGVVTLAFPEKFTNVYRELLLEATTIPCPQTENGTISLRALDLLLKKSKDYDVVAIGPGLSQDTETQELIREFLTKTESKLVLDADALNALVGNTHLFKKIQKRAIITPHPGEMSRLTEISMGIIQEDRVGSAQKYAKEWDKIVVLKGYNTIIAHPDGRTIINKSGGPSLATAGTGDVLLGVIASMWAQNPKKPFNSTATAVYIHGLAGDLAEEKFGERSVIASDVIELIPLVIKEITKLLRR